MPLEEELEPNNDENFSAAFAELTAPGETRPEPVAAEPAAEPALAPVAAEPAAEPALAPVAAEPAAEPALAPVAAEPAPVTAEPASAQKEDDDALLARLAGLVSKTPQAPAPAVELAPAAYEPAAEIYTTEEKDFLASYETDWPDVAKAEALKRRAEYRDLVAFVFQEVAGQLAPLTGTVQTLAERTHLGDLNNQVSDYEEIRDKVVDWVPTQPKYLQDAYNRVIAEGTVEEVKDLIDRYRGDTGATFVKPVEPKVEAELPPATKKAAAAMAPVSSKRSVVPQPSEPGDFDSAFALAAESV